MKRLTLIIAFVCAWFFSSAQMNISGNVTDFSSGEAIPGVTVSVNGLTNTVTITDFDGKYSLEVPEEGKSLTFMYIGMKTQTVEITNQTVINVQLEDDAFALDNVVVTALGIKREKKSLGYSVQDVSGDILGEGGNNNVVSALSGKIAGVQITTSSGAVGASSSIKIRGNKSFSGSTSPLFVIDGVPVSNGSSTATSADFGNAAQDIDMSNVENVSVLKGPAATALYGSRGSNGVILITTKKGEKGKGIGVSFSSSITFDEVYILPAYQNKYGQGSRGSEYYWKQYNPNEEIPYTEYSEDRWEWSPNNTSDVSWGARLDQEGVNIIQFDSDVDENGDKIPSPWISRPDNIKNFYETGITTSNSVSLSGGSDVALGRLTLSQVSQKGTTPNTDQTKYNFGLNTSVKLSEKLKFDVNTNFNITENDNLPKQGSSLMNPLYEFNNWFGRQVNVESLKDHYDEYIEHPNGTVSRYNWLTGYSGYNNNPYWNQYMNTTARDRKRIFGSVSTTYTFIEGIDLMLRVGTDYINEHRKTVFTSGTKGTLISGFQNPINGSFWEQYRSENETNADLMLTVNKDINENFSTSFVAGANYRSSFSRYSTTSVGALLIPDFFSTSAVDGEVSTTNNLYQKITNSLFGAANVGYKDYLYLDLTYRRDWSSSLPKEHWAFGYYSATLGFIFSDALQITNNIFSYGKIRGSIAEVGTGTGPYSLNNYYTNYGSVFAGEGGDINLYRLSSTLFSPDLDSERTRSIELGSELKFFSNRLGLDFAYYDAVTYNLIMYVPLAPSEGFSVLKKNAGEIRNWGVEIQMYATPIKKKNFSWDILFNYSKNKNIILDLDKEIEEDGIRLNSFYKASLWAKEGEEWGTLYGTARSKDENGNFLITEYGRYIATEEPVNLGSVNPDFIGGLRNTFSYKNISLSGLIDFRFGGVIISKSKLVGQHTGILEATVTDNQREEGIIAEGVFEEGVLDDEGNDISGQPNDVVISSQQYWYSNELRNFADVGIIDGSFIKFRELALSYNLPRDWIKRIKLQSLTLSVLGRNLALLYTDESNDVHIDPEVAATGSVLNTGYESFNLAPSRSIGFKIDIKF